MRKIVAKYEKNLVRVQEEFAKELSSHQKTKFSLPLKPRELSVLQDLVDALFPDLNNKISQREDDNTFCFAFSASPSLKVETIFMEKLFSYFFEKKIESDGYPSCFVNQRTLFFEEV